MITRENFKRLIYAIREHGTLNHRELNGQVYKVYEVSELTLVMSQRQKGWVPEGITFELFGAEFFLTQDGAISIIEDSDNENDTIYSLSDQTLLSVVSNFLVWRLKILEKMMM